MDLLLQVLTDDFSLEEMEVLVWHVWRKDLEKVARNGAQPFVAKEIVSWADRHGERARLAVAVRDARPRDRRVLNVADELLETPFRRPYGELQRYIFEHVPLLDPLPWFAQALETAAKVCVVRWRISSTRFSLGTGFLIAKDLVLTANHVVDDVDDPEKIEIVFDYARTREGEPVNKGVLYRVATHQWLVSSREPSVLDEKPRDDELPRPRELDFAVLRLARPAGEHSVGADSAVTGIPPRRWIECSPNAPTFERDAPLLIYHFPAGESLRLSVEMRSIVGVNANGTRLHHRTNTLGGSSGAPCFDASWQVIAMHQSAQTSDGLHHNQAIPIGPIVSALREDAVSTGAA